MMLSNINYSSLSNDIYDNLKSYIKENSSEITEIPTKLKSKLSEKIKIKAVLFDIYGTILISGSGDISIAKENGDSINLRSISKGLDIIFPTNETIEIKQHLHKYIKHSHSLSLKNNILSPEVDITNVWANVLNELNNNNLINCNIDIKLISQLAIRYELATNPIWPMKRAKETLNKIYSKGIPIGIVSNAQFYTPLSLEALLDCNLSNWNIKEENSGWSYIEGCSKPNESIFSKPINWLNKNGIENSEILYVGNDMLNDVYTASILGLKTALFAGDERSLRLREGDKRTLDLKSDFILTELIELLEII